uniref:Uncharacterized protein n=1 Tax=Cucumis melo TaxID=3656 RepID=A0A9I9CD97_CUCME
NTEGSAVRRSHPSLISFGLKQLRDLPAASVPTAGGIPSFQRRASCVVCKSPPPSFAGR